MVILEVGVAKVGKHSTFLKYGAEWHAEADPLTIEFAMILRGGRFEFRGRRCGEGLPYHVKQAIKLLWPQRYWHRWSDLMCDAFLKSPGRTGCFGPSSSQKSFTFTMCALAMFYARPKGTTVLISSTTRDDLQRRIWGYVVDLDKEARERYPDLPGHFIESELKLLADAKDVDGRSKRDGLMGVACKKGGQWEGLEAYVGTKNSVLILVCDECFVEGTPVDTPTGPKPIEAIRPGDLVRNAVGVGTVKAISRSVTSRLAYIRLTNGEYFFCTPNHPFLTQHGWKKACELNETHYIISQHEAMRHLWFEPQTKSETILRECLLSEVEANTRVAREIPADFDFSAFETTELGKGASASDEALQPDALSSVSAKDGGNSATHKAQALHQRRQRHRTNKGRSGAPEIIPLSSLESPRKNWQAKRQRLSNYLQSRFGVPASKAGDRSGWSFAWFASQACAGRQEDKAVKRTRVARVKILKQSDIRAAGLGDGYAHVYNLQVSDHPSYSVKGRLVHNCQFMPVGFLDALANLESNEPCYAALMGNLPDVENPLGWACEPKHGWESLPDTEISRVFETRWVRGRAIQLVGMDSPNLDYPEGQEPYRGLIGRRYIEQCRANYGSDTTKFHMFASGKVPQQGMHCTVFTKAEAIKHDASSTVVWGHEKLVRGYGLDAAYSGLGGDRTVGFPFVFGKDSRGKWRFQLGTMKVYPGSRDPKLTHAEAIATECRQECEMHGIPAEHVFFDGTGRSELTSAFARLWSSEVVPIEFGGAATQRPTFTGDKWRTNERKEKSPGTPKLCADVFQYFVSELWFALKHCIVADQMRGMPQEAIDEGSLRKFEIVTGGKERVEAKADMKERGLRSPDICDAIVCALEGARRLGFPLGQHVTPDKQDKTQTWLRAVQQEQWKKREGEVLAA